MTSTFRHIALVVPDPRQAEAYYQSLFEMELIGREAELEDGLWYSLPFDKDWDDAQAAGIELGMLALRTVLVMPSLTAEIHFASGLELITLAQPQASTTACFRAKPR